MRWCLLLISLIAFAVSDTEQACPQSTDPCSVAPCPCAGFTVVRIQTNAQNGVTQVVINATNYCTDAVYYVNFGLTDGKTTLTASTPGTVFNSQYAWDVNTKFVTSNPTRTWIQFSNKGGGTNTKMRKGSGASQWELFTFSVTGYKPTFGWYFQMHEGDKWDTYGPLDMSLCQCTNCDAGFSQRTIQPCVVGYADASGTYSGTTNRAFSVFNENQVLYSYAMYNNLLALFYSDEYPMTLGIQTITNSLTSETRTYPFSNGTQSPICILGSNIKFGSTSFDGLDPWSAIDGNGPANGCNELKPPVVGKTCGRPMPPVMFISDITAQKNNISGDWQMYGNGVLPSKVCGLWQASVKTITGKNADGTFQFSVVPVTKSIPPPNQNPVGTGLPAWNLGTGADPPPIGFVNPSAVGLVPYLNKYGVEVAWDLDTLGLISTHSYRFQFLVHDGDSTKVGGDVGQACLITTQACPAGFSGTACDKCDTNPLPNDGSWTWFCSNTGSNPPYNLLKLPTEKVKAAPYLGNGFIPSLNFNDSQGYIIECNCVRKTFPCPQNCCGNGACQAQNGTCKCVAGSPAGTNLSTCCLPPPPPPPPPTCVANVSKVPGINCTTCISNTFGLSCAWCAAPGVQAWTTQALVNGTCTAPKACTGTEFTTCNLPPPPPPPPTCVANLTQAKGTNCTTCVSNIYGLTCAWCPAINQSLWLQTALTTGTCQLYDNCPGVELHSCTLQPPPPPPVAPPVTPPTAVPVYNPVCSDMTSATYGGNQSCGACISNTRGLQCAWCPYNISADPPAQTLVDGNCTVITGTCKSPLMFTCVAPPPPPPPPPKPTCENITVGPNFKEVNCSVCLGNPYGLTCVWCSDAGTTGLAILQNGTCMTDATTCPNSVSLTCDLPPPPPPPVTCENVSQIPGINCSTCISNAFSIQCAWCATPSNKTNGTCGAYGSCGADIELYACNQPCYNDGNFCSGHGSCVNDTCVCDPQIGTGLGYEGPACNVTVYPPPLTCANVTGVFNCSDCFAQSAILGVRCAWCPNSTDPLRILTSGQCVEDFICGNSSYYSCTPPSVFVPPECADNCSNHGMCVNISTCKEIQSMDQGALIIKTTEDGKEVTKIYTCDPENLNQTLTNNQSSLCACLDPYTGVNCGVIGAGVNIKLAAGIAAGIIAAIVVLGILGLALCGGGAAAAASAVAAAPAAGVDMNPLYVGNDSSADNPLYA